MTLFCEAIHEEKFTIMEEAWKAALEVAKEEDAKAKETSAKAEVIKFFCHVVFAFLYSGGDTLYSTLPTTDFYH